MRVCIRFVWSVLLTLACWPTSLASAQEIIITPEVALADERISVRVVGLEPNQPVIVRATARDVEGRAWHAYAGFYSDAKGHVDLDRQRPIHGSYQEADSMRLITSMDVPGEGRGRTRFAVRGWEPWTVTFAVEIGGRTVASKEHQRVYGRDLTVTPVLEKDLHGVLFRRSSATDLPGVLILSGSEGGLSGEDMAAVLASRGYAAFVLAYFSAEGLPPALEAIPVEYFLRALDWLGRQEGVDARRLAILGTSKGSEAALLVATMAPQLRAVVAYAPSSVVWSCICSKPTSSWSIRGEPVPFVAAGSDPTYKPPAGFPITPTANYRYRLAHVPDLNLVSIPVERISAQMMLISGQDDQLWHSDDMALAIMARLRKAGKAGRATHLSYKDAGHLIGKAFYPATATLVGGLRLETGGTPKGNAAAQADSWPKVLSFLNASQRAIVTAYCGGADRLRQSGSGTPLGPSAAPGAGASACGTTISDY